MQAEWVFLNGKMVRADRARVSVFDRGLMYGDGLFETMRVYNGRPFLLDAHLARWQRSAGALGLRLPDFAWRSVISRLLQRNQCEGDGWLRMMVTRGPGARGLLPPEEISPTTILACGPLDPKLAGQQRRGVGITLLAAGRNPWLAQHKTTNYLDGVMGKVEAAGRGCHEGIFTQNGRVTEGTTSNIFVWRDNILCTPGPDGILAGVSRAHVLTLARAAGFRVREASLRRSDLIAAQEVFLTSSIAEVMPVVSVDGQPVGNGRPGERTLQLRRKYRRTTLAAPALAVGSKPRLR